MRAPVAFAVLAVAVPAAHADNFVELAGGLMTPVSDDQWTDYVESSPKFAARVGSYGAKAGGVFSIDWTPVNTDNMGLGNNVDVSSHRFRILLGAMTQQKAGDKLFLSFRLQGGLDISYVSVYASAFGFTIDDSDTDVGFALEPAAGLWFNVGSVQLGGELALPISLFHDDGDDNDINLEAYTSLDVDLLFGLRIRQ